MKAWRPMRASDLDAVLAVGAAVHPGLPESRAMFAERQRLFPGGCLVLESEGAVAGYAVSHPIRRFAPPALDSLLGALPAEADDYYIHDIAILPGQRGGTSREAITRLLAVADAYPTTSLVSVYGTAGFWSRYGFSPVDRDMIAKLAPYGAGAVYMVRDNRQTAERQAGETERPFSG